MAETHDAGELVEPQAAERDAEFFPINDLPKELIVSVFMAVEDLRWVRHTVPCVCKAWNELYCSKDASPLHETLEVDFRWEAEKANQEMLRRGARPLTGAAALWLPPYSRIVHASRVILWAERRAGSVRKLRLKARSFGALDDFTATDLGALVSVVGSSLTEISVGPYLGGLCKRPFWESLRTSVVPAGRLRSFASSSITSDSFGSDVEPLLGQLAGSLEELELQRELDPREEGLPRFPESLCALTKLKRLVLVSNPQLTAIPAGISSLKKLEELDLRYCGVSSLPKELGELSRLTKLDLYYNGNLKTAPPAFVDEEDDDEEDDDEDLRTRPESEVFPAGLGKMKSLRVLSLHQCGLRTVPAFVGEQKSLESLDLSVNYISSLPKELGELSRLTSLKLGGNVKLGNRPQDEAFPAELGKMKSLRELHLTDCGLRTVPAFVGGLESLEILELSSNGLQFAAPLDFLIEGCPRLLHVGLFPFYESIRRTPEARAHLEAFKAKLLAKNPDAEVFPF